MTSLENESTCSVTGTKDDSLSGDSSQGVTLRDPDMTSLENESTSLSESIHTSNENEEESLSADSTKSLEKDSIHNL